jgi:hypothetical protein
MQSRLLAATAFSCLAAACSPGVTGPVVEPVTEFVLAPGEAASVTSAGLTVRFERVTSDSRCPADALCVTAGEAEVAVWVRRDGRPADVLALRTVPNGSRAEVGDWVVSLVRLDPYPFSSQGPIAPGDYRATFKVDPAAPPARR